MTGNVDGPGYTKRAGYHAGLLGGMALIISGVLVVGYQQTREAIAQRLEEDTRASLAQVIPATLHDNEMLKDVVLISPTEDETTVRVYQARRDGAVTGVAFQVVEQGYAGPIQLIIGVDRNGKILGVRVIAHTETPGLGDKIEEAKSDWILRFTGLSKDDPGTEGWKVKKDGGHFDQFSGATITPRAVVKGVKKGLDFFHAHRAEMIGANTDEQTAQPIETTSNEG